MSPAAVPRRHIRLLLALGLLLVVVVATVAVVVLTRSDDRQEPRPTGNGCARLPAAPSGQRSSRPFVGSLITEPGTAERESRAGIKMAMLELSWREFEPQQGEFNSSYARQACTQLARFREAGMQVTLGLGMHYTPRWVLDRDDSRYVNQKGESSDQADLVFNRDNRDLATDYLEHVDAEIGLQNFWAVRITSGGNSELFYPGGGDYWAFSKAKRPDGLAPNPLPDWKPGTGDTSPSVAARGTWARWYVGALSNVADWQTGELRRLGFHGYVQVLTPGQGLRPAEVLDRVRSGLPTGLLGRGAVWSWVYGGLRDHDDVTAYVSSVADGSGSDDTCRDSDDSVALDSGEVRGWSATRWISRLAHENGLTVAGENSAYPTSPTAQRRYTDASADGVPRSAYAQASSCGLLGLYWAHDAQLQDNRDLLRIVAGLAGDDPQPPAAAR